MSMDSITLSDQWNMMPRIPVNQNLMNEKYQELVGSILSENGIVNDLKINIIQNLKVDIEGDGTDEVVIVAENIDPKVSNFSNEAYSIVFIRKIIDDEVETIFLAKDVIGTDESDFEQVSVSRRVIGVIDSDGNGELELLIESVSMDGLDYGLYQFHNNTFQLLLNSFK